MATFTPTRLQHGTWNTNASNWVNNLVGNIATNQLIEIWAQWDVTQESLNYLTAATLQFSYTPADVGNTYAFDLMVLDTTLTGDFSNSNPPSKETSATPNPAQSVQSPIMKISTAFDTRTLVGTPETFTLDLNTAVGQATDLHHALRAGRTPDGNGIKRFALGLRLNRQSTDTLLEGVTLQTLTLTGEPQFTGLEGPYHAYGRADECPKCGSKSTRDTWVRDGYTDMMVCAKCYDEEDLVGRHYQGLGSERPGQGEG